MNNVKQRAKEAVEKFLNARPSQPLKHNGDKALNRLQGYLKESVLVENAHLSSKTHKSLSLAAANFYYGINVSPEEPIDQIDSLLVGRRIAEIMQSKMTVLIAGKFGLFNSTIGTDLGFRGDMFDSLELKKRVLISAAMKHFGIDGNSVLTNDLWGDPYYWHLVANLYNSRSSLPSQRAYSGIETKVDFAAIPLSQLRNIPQEVFDLLSREKATTLYSIAEIAESLYLKEKHSVILKIGPKAEEEYDKYIQNSLDTIHLFQPTDLRSTTAKPRPVTPYILRQGEEKTRLIFTDQEKQVYEKIQKFSTEAQPLFYAGTIHPILRLLAFVDEAEHIAGNVPRTADQILSKPLAKSSVRKGEHGEKELYMRMRSSLQAIALAVEKTIIAPIRELIGYEK